MKLSALSQPRKGIDLTPMVDVIFLLVIFFMTSSSLVKIKTIKLDLPKSSYNKPLSKKLLTISIKKNGDLFFQGKSINENQLKITLQKSMKNLKTSENKTLIIQGDKNVNYEKIVAVMSIAKKSGVSHISLATLSKNN